jgi:HSP20 family protein
MLALKPVTNRGTALLPRVERPFGWLPNDFATLFNRFFTDWPIMEAPNWEYPWGLTTEEKEKEFLVRVELPGFEPAEVKVELTGNLLTVEAEHKVPEEKEKVERAYAHVKRELTLPEGVELEKVEAVYRNGVLEVHLPRKPEAAGRRIEVKT